MIEKLKIKALYNDFVNKVNLSEEQKRILNMIVMDVEAMEIMANMEETMVLEDMIQNIVEKKT